MEYYHDVVKAESPTMVLLHGFPFSSERWSRQMQMLQEKKLRVIACDIRDHGQSDVGDGQYAIDLFVDEIDY